MVAPLLKLIYNVDMQTLKQLRKERGFTQEEMCSIVNIPHRTYQRYEADDTNVEMEKLNELISKILKLSEVDEEHGILSIPEIANKIKFVCANYPQVKCIYLFGSYARGEMRETSDVDLYYIADNMKALDVANLAFDLKEKLHKNIDLLCAANISDNEKFIDDILYEGIKIYDKRRRNQII